MNWRPDYKKRTCVVQRTDSSELFVL